MARYRTVLANERTFLSYTRTSLGVAAVGFFAFKFAPAGWNLFLGTLAIIAAFAVWIFGLRRYRLSAAIIRNGRPSHGKEY